MATEIEIGNIVQEFSIGKTRIKIADNYCAGKTQNEVNESLRRVARNAQDHISFHCGGQMLGINVIEGGMKVRNFYRECPICHANLDPGEHCDCINEKEQEAKRMQRLCVKEGKSNQLTFNWDLDKVGV